MCQVNHITKSKAIAIFNSTRCLSKANTKKKLQSRNAFKYKHIKKKENYFLAKQKLC